MRSIAETIYNVDLDPEDTEVETIHTVVECADSSQILDAFFAKLGF